MNTALIVLIALRLATIYFVLNSAKFRGYTRIRPWDVKALCWVLVMPFIGDVVMIFTWLIFVLVFIDKEIFVVK